jgi:hypothetical protein
MIGPAETPDVERPRGASSGAMAVAFFLAWLQIIGSLLGGFAIAGRFRKFGVLATGVVALMAIPVLFLLRNRHARIFLAGQHVIMIVICVMAAFFYLAVHPPALFIVAIPLLFSVAGAWAFVTPAVRRWTSRGGPGTIQRE